MLANCHLGHLRYRRGDTAGAMALYRRALALDPRSAQAHYYLGLAFADAKIFREAIREWEEVAKIAPDSDLGRTAAENAALIRRYIELDEP